MSERRFSFRLLHALLAAALCLLLTASFARAPGYRAYAAAVPGQAEGQTEELTEDETEAEGSEVSGADAPGSEVSAADIEDDHFKRVGMIPLNVDIPYFYSEVANISGMYIFTLPDGTVYKRIYGALDDRYGWYEPQGYDNRVPPGSPPIDTADDIALYEDALEAAGIIKQYTSDYYGILPPEQGTSAVNALFGKPSMFIFILCGIITAVLCAVILVSSASKKKNAQSPPGVLGSPDSPGAIGPPGAPVGLSGPPGPDGRPLPRR